MAGAQIFFVSLQFERSKPLKSLSFVSGIIFVGFLLAPFTSAWSQTFTTLSYFRDGSSIFSSLVQGRDGSLYGTSNDGGTSGFGSVFKLSLSGTLTILYSFCANANCSDGSYPSSALALGIDGNLYGTTQNGGTTDQGTVFRISPSGLLTVLHNFVGSDGSSPESGLALGTDGSFYGTTGAGGTGGAGTVFRINAEGILTTLHAFAGTDGAYPSAALLMGSDGNFYGTTPTGGTSSACNGSCGTVFKISPSGKFMLLHSFEFTDGEEPLAPLAQSSDGAYYGTTYEGGNSRSSGGGYGTIFKVGSGGAFSTVHRFDGRDGGYLNYGLTPAADGSLYAESALGGDEAAGQIFALTQNKIITSYNFLAIAGQGAGDTAMLQSTDGKFYATYGYAPSAVFSFDIGFGPFVTFVLPSAKVGQSAQILGQGFVGPTSVTFNGVQATSFKVVADTYMTAVVPVGATTGPVVVTTTAGGPLTSNVNFRITK